MILGPSPANWRNLMGSRSPYWCGCEATAASMPTRHQRTGSKLGGHGGMARSSHVPTSGPGGHPRVNTTRSTRSMEMYGCAPGLTCTRKRTIIPPKAATARKPWCAARWSWSRLSAYRARRVFPNASGCGGADRANPTWRSSGEPTSIGLIWSTPIASASRRSIGPRHACGLRSRLTAGPGSSRWLTRQLRLARRTIEEVCLPWERPQRPDRRMLTPGRVRQAFLQLLVTLDTPANAPKPCGRSPGRPKGARSGRAPRFPAFKKAA